MNYRKTINWLENKYDEKSTIRLKDMKNKFKHNLDSVNPVIYDVFIKNLSPIKLGLTEINPGNVNGEFYMTRGHVHKKKTPEFYILLEGKGMLVIQKNNKIKSIKLKIREVTFVPSGYAHRLINLGAKKLKALTIYQEDSMPNYNIKFKKRFFKK